MNEPIRKRHQNITTRELALKHGVCQRTIRNIVAEKREDFEQRARCRRRLVFEMRHYQRRSYREIAEAVNTSLPGARRLFCVARREHLTQ